MCVPLTRYLRALRVLWFYVYRYVVLELPNVCSGVATAFKWNSRYTRNLLLVLLTITTTSHAWPRLTILLRTM